MNKDSAQLDRSRLMEQEEPQPQGPSKAKAFLILVAILCGACLVISGFVVMTVLGAYCIGAPSEFCPGLLGSILMLAVGFAPFFVLMVVMVYNAIYFNLGPGDGGNWIEMQL